MMNNSNTHIHNVAVHKVGNKTNADELILSKSELDISDEKVKELLFKFFLHSFSNPEYNSFTFSNNDFKLNPIFNFVSDVFDNPKNFFKNSLNVAKYLFELSVHPQIKPGDLLFAYFTDVNIEGTITDAIGIYKSENRQAFLKLDNDNSNFYIAPNEGINVDKLDKGCLILNIEKDSGFKVCVIDNTNKGNEAQYWKNDFLKVKTCNDSFHATKDYLNMCKTFVTTQMPKEYEVTKTDQIDILNKSINYFREQDAFDVDEFSKNVIANPQVIESFKDFKKQYAQDKDIEFADSFDISDEAVKKQNRIFKSVLKLDKNFHIYIHGNRNLIEKGTDEKTGKQFYKIYFDEES